MPYSIVPISEAHFAGLHAAMDTVAREQRYLAFLRAPPHEQSFAFYRNIVTNDLCQFVALDGDEVVGWCDILPVMGETRAHVGTLGIGLMPHARHRGLGPRLLRATIDKAWAKGLTRLELTVRVDNPAKALYERFGFEHEGIRRNAFLIDGEYFDTHAMALLKPTS
jgi:ribosomal protein S18 acetylase RimI-like enzyme